MPLTCCTPHSAAECDAKLLPSFARRVYLIVVVFSQARAERESHTATTGAEARKGADAASSPPPPTPRTSRIGLRCQQAISWSSFEGRLMSGAGSGRGLCFLGWHAAALVCYPATRCSRVVARGQLRVIAHLYSLNLRCEWHIVSRWHRRPP